MTKEKKCDYCDTEKNIVLFDNNSDTCIECVRLKGKNCRTCKEFKSIFNFDSHRSVCKECRKSKNQAYYQKNKEKIWKITPKTQVDEE